MSELYIFFRWGVPQGSIILGPTLLVCYIEIFVCDIINRDTISISQCAVSLTAVHLKLKVSGRTKNVI